MVAASNSAEEQLRVGEIATTTSLSNIASTIDEANDYETNAVTAVYRKPGLAISFVEVA